MWWPAPTTRSGPELRRLEFGGRDRVALAALGRRHGPRTREDARRIAGERFELSSGGSAETGKQVRQRDASELVVVFLRESAFAALPVGDGDLVDAHRAGELLLRQPEDRLAQEAGLLGREDPRLGE